jgi:VanZ family protein
MPPSRSSQLWKLAFFVAAILAVTMASLPNLHVPGNPPDKLLHILAFLALTVLAQLAFPLAKMRILLLGLGALGAGIELIQAIPTINRDASLTDWLADMVAIVIAITIFQTSRWLVTNRRIGWGKGVP